MDLPKTYIPKDYEDAIYKKWEASGCFNPDNLKVDKKAKSFTISMPPPNATGVLHVGHTLGITLQDIMTRYHRMQGKKTLLVPGTDHAAIATQNVVEKILRQEKTSRHELGREKFLARTNKYVEQNKTTINNQTRKMGASCDWSREAYTMSEDLNLAVNTQFKKMYDDGLIYRGDRIVNWCPRCYSTLSDDEVDHKEQQAKFWTFKYNADFPISIATTRPETKLGDTAVAVNPADKRYKKYIGQEFKVNFVGIKLNIKIIANKEVDMDFGTGALGVTPAHSMVDWQMAEENNLEIKKVIGQDGKILKGFGEYSGLKVKEAREKIITNLEQAGLIKQEEKIKNNLAICYRCGTEIEPLPSLQWFVGVNKEFTLTQPELIKKFGKKKTTLKEISKWAVESGEIKIVPNYFTKTYFHWMDNLKDWCISRQIWFGHRIPVYYRKQEISKSQFPISNKMSKVKCQMSDKNIYVGVDKPAGDNWEQDPDTLDTWFSSGLWTFSTLGWPNEKSIDLKTFHPTDVMETMHDILFFWVARMIMMSLYALNEVPFKTVYLHGMVCDKHGNKMSKSKPETCIDPLDVAEKYGTDALRLSMVIGNSAGTKLNLSEQKIASFRNFANKLWNIGRFIQFQEEQNKLVYQLKNKPITLADQWITSKLNNLIKETTEDLEKFRFGLAGEKLYDFTWHTLADWYVEIAKTQSNNNTYSLLIDIYKTLLKLLHPFTPFVTEKIWEYLENDNLLITTKWPIINKTENNTQAEQDFELIQELITAIRSWKKENKIEPKEILKIQIAGSNKLINSQQTIINHLAKVELTTAEALADKDFEVRELKIKILNH